VNRRTLAIGLIACAMTVQSACRRTAKVTQPEPEVTVVLPEEPEPSAVVNLEPPPIPPPPPEPPARLPAAVAPRPSLGDADKAFTAGNYASAARSYRRYLDAKEAQRDRDRALYQLGVSQALMGSSPRGRTMAESTLESLVSQYPKSPYAASGRLVLDLLRENRRLRGDGTTKDETIKRLQEDLERLKKIDMDRRPPPPR
jgi:hypothetical protein